MDTENLRKAHMAELREGQIPAGAYILPDKLLEARDVLLRLQDQRAVLTGLEKGLRRGGVDAAARAIITAAAFSARQKAEGAEEVLRAMGFKIDGGGPA